MLLCTHSPSRVICKPPADSNKFRLPGKGVGNPAMSWLPESEPRLHSYAGCCKRYTLSATDFSSTRERRFSLRTDDRPREEFLSRQRGSTSRSQ